VSSLTRRQFAGGCAALLAAPASLVTSRAALAQATRLRCFWWGNPERDKRTKTALDAYSQKAGTQIAAESLGWGDYWTKLGTQTAGGNAPDLTRREANFLKIHRV